MYFNHAYRKSFLAADDNATDGIMDQKTSGSTSALLAGEIGLFDAKTYDAFADENSGHPFILAQGSYFTKDKIGPFHGGYQESVKSKVINPKYITRIFTTCAREPVNQIVDVCVCKLECGKTYRLRLDLKGSPALRFLSHNIYKTLDAFTGCCTDDCSATCTGALTDPTLAVIKWAKQIADSPILSQFLQVEVVDFNGDAVADNLTGGSTPLFADFEAALDAHVPIPAWDPADPGAATAQACIKLHVAYVDTKFASCTFTPTDFYELMPLQVYASLTDETGDACNVQCVTITESQAPAQAQGVGETVLRDLILTGRYRQEAYPDSSRVESLRMREIEANPVLTAVDRNGLYNSVNILHSVPRFNNPSGTFDNDQYLLTIYLKVGINATAFVAQLQAILDFCCPGLDIEHYNGPCDFLTTTTSTTTTTTT